MNIKKYIKNHTGITIAIIIIAVMVMIIAGRMSAGKGDSRVNTNMKRVELVDASSFRADLSTVAVDGVVESVSQVDLKSQVGAPLAVVYVGVGDTVYAGQLLAEFQNGDIRAQLEQAKASLGLVKGQDISGSSQAIQRLTVDRLREYYIKADDVINGQIGQFVYSGNATQPQLQQGLTDWRLADNLSLQYTDMKSAFQQWKKSIDSLSYTSSQSDLDASLRVSQASLSTISKFLDTVSLALIDRSQYAQGADLVLVNGWRTVVTAARGTISASISSLTTTGISLGNNPGEVTVAEAGVKALQAQLAKTIITSPISGKIATFPLRAGEFASPGQLITTVVGEGGLQIKAYASSEDLNRIKKDAKVLIRDTVTGVVTSVAPSINQLNKKVEIKILVQNSASSNLVIGQNVQAKIEVLKSPSTVVASSTSYILPIQNVKIVPGSAYVYTLDAESKVVKHEVILGEVKGDYIEVKSGINDTMKIISPVYELEEGQMVTL